MMSRPYPMMPPPGCLVPRLLSWLSGSRNDDHTAPDTRGPPLSECPSPFLHGHPTLLGFLVSS